MKNKIIALLLPGFGASIILAVAALFFKSIFWWYIGIYSICAIFMIIVILRR